MALTLLIARSTLCLPACLPACLSLNDLRSGTPPRAHLDHPGHYKDYFQPPHHHHSLPRQLHQQFGADGYGYGVPRVRSLANSPVAGSPGHPSHYPERDNPFARDAPHHYAQATGIVPPGRLKRELSCLGPGQMPGGYHELRKDMQTRTHKHIIIYICTFHTASLPLYFFFMSISSSTCAGDESGRLLRDSGQSSNEDKVKAENGSASGCSQSRIQRQVGKLHHHSAHCIV